MFDNVKFTIENNHFHAPLVVLENSTSFFENCDFVYHGSEYCILEKVTTSTCRSVWKELTFDGNVSDVKKGIYSLHIENDATLCQQWTSVHVQPNHWTSQSMFQVTSHGGHLQQSITQFTVYDCGRESALQIPLLFSYDIVDGTFRGRVEHSILHLFSETDLIAFFIQIKTQQGYESTFHLSDNQIELCGQVFQLILLDTTHCSVTFRNNEFSQRQHTPLSMISIENHDNTLLSWTISENRFTGYSTESVVREHYQDSSVCHVSSNFNFYTHRGQKGPMCQRTLENFSHVKIIESNAVKLFQGNGYVEHITLHDEASFDYSADTYSAEAPFFLWIETHEQSRCQWRAINSTFTYVGVVDTDGSISNTSPFHIVSHEQSVLSFFSQVRSIQTFLTDTFSSPLHTLNCFDSSQVAFMLKNDQIEFVSQPSDTFFVNTFQEARLSFSIIESFVTNCHQYIVSWAMDTSIFQSRLENVTLKGLSVLNYTHDTVATCEHTLINSHFMRTLSTFSLVRILQKKSGKINCFLVNDIFECNSQVRGQPLIQTEGVSINKTETPLNLGMSNGKCMTNGCVCLQTVATILSLVSTELSNDIQRR